MLEFSQSLLPTHPDGRNLKVLCVGQDDESLAELGRLLTTLGADSIGHVFMVSKNINPATYIGQGKAQEAKETAERLNAEAIVFDFELSPNQLRNLEKALSKPVLDRPGVIIEIFSRHARTKESKTQVELARLQYLLPRLAHFWTHFERQKGGIGMKGMGEKQIEVDRRLVKKRMQILNSRLKTVANERNLQRSGRRDIIKVAIVGYTNAGKSTLLNTMTESAVRAEDKLFATLDSSVRALTPDSRPPIVMIDTVGFIKRLPPTLVASFRSTLEELHEADLLLHVFDGSSKTAKEEVQVTEEILKDLEVDSKPRLVVLNKVDRLDTQALRNQARIAYPGAIAVSALNLDDVKKLRELVIEYFRKGFEIFEIVLPYEESKLEAMIHKHGTIEKKNHLEKGTFFKFRMETEWAQKLGVSRFKT